MCATALSRAALHGCTCKGRACAIPLTGWKKERNKKKGKARQEGWRGENEWRERETGQREDTEERGPRIHHVSPFLGASYNPDIHTGGGSSIEGGTTAGATVTDGRHKSQLSGRTRRLSGVMEGYAPRVLEYSSEVLELRRNILFPASENIPGF